MGIKIKNLQTGEFEKFNIPALKGEKGEPGEIEPSEKVDYIGKQHSKLRDTMNANVDYIIKTAIGEFNYLDYEGQHITATNTIEGHAKSAILKGQTLVNLAQPSLRAWTANLNSDTASLKATTEEFIIDWSKGVPFNAWIQARNDNSPVFGGMLKADTDYTFIIRILENNPTFEGVAVTGNVANLQMWGVKGYQSMYYSLRAGVTGTIALKYNFKTLLTGQNIENIFGIAVVGTASNGTKTIDGGKLRISKDIIVLEGDYTNNYQHIPYFEGMQSVKMPVLTTVGKNLFDISQVTNFDVVNNNIIVPKNSGKKELIPLSTINPNQPIAITLKHNVTQPNGSWTPMIGVLYTDGTNVEKYFHQLPLITADNKIIDTIYIRNPWSVGAELYDVQIEEGTQATPYEPFKSNILHTPEEVVLRSLPNGVCNTLNLMTGEYIQRIGEVVLDGTQNWTLKTGNWEFENTFGFVTTISDMINTTQSHPAHSNGNSLVCSHFPSYGGNSLSNNALPNDIEMIGIDLNRLLGLRITKTKLSTPNAEGLKTWLRDNPVTVQYELATPIIKTVDLSDNVVYSYGSTTHYSCSSEEGSLVPTLSVKVPTDTQLTIQEQKATIQTLLIKNMDLQQSIKEVQAMNLAFNTALYNSFNSIREEVEDIKKHVSTNENLEGSF